MPYRIFGAVLVFISSFALGFMLHDRIVKLLPEKKVFNEYENVKYIEHREEVILDIKPFSNKKLAFYITATTQQIDDRDVSAKNVYFEDKEGKRNIYHQSVYKYEGDEEKIREDLLTIYSKPKEKSLEDFLFEIITTAYKDYYKDFGEDFGEAEKEGLEDVKKVCKIEEYYYGTYIFSQDKSFDEYLKNKYGEGLHVERFCPAGVYTYFQNENLIIGIRRGIMSADEVKVYRDPTGSRLRLID